MIKGKYSQTMIEQEWHLYETNYGSDNPTEDSLCLVITHNRDYAIAQYVLKGSVLDCQYTSNGITHAILAEENGFYTLETFDGEKTEVKKLNVSAWTELQSVQNIFDTMVKK